MKAGDKMPLDKTQALENVIMKCLQDNEEMFKDDVPQEILESAKKMEFTQDLLNYCYGIRQQKLSNKDKQNPHGKVIIDVFTKNDQLGDFIKMWRKHFLENNETKFLPTGWRIDHKLERQFGENSIFCKND